MEETAVHAALEAILSWADGLLPSYYRQFLLDYPAGISTEVVVLYQIEAHRAKRHLREQEVLPGPHYRR
jgi:hypothetical protein